MLKIKLGSRLTTKLIDQQRIYGILYASAIWFVPSRSMLIAFGDFLYPSIGNIFSKLSILCFLYFLVLPLFIIKEKPTVDMVIIFCALAFSWLIGLLKNIDVLKEDVSIGISIFIKAFPYYCIARKIKDWKQTKEFVYISALFATVFMAIATFFDVQTGTLYAEGTIYNQFYGIILCPAAIISLIAFFEKGSSIYLLILGIDILLMYHFGARSPFLCLGIAILCMFLKIIQQLTKNGKIQKHLYMALGFGGLILISSIGLIANILISSDMSQPFGEGQRFLYLLQRGSLFRSDGRIQIYKNALNLIFEYPLLGTGLITDRRLLANLNGISSDFLGSYAHNFFLEILLQYGVLLGGILALIVLYAVYSCLFREKNIHRSLLSIFCISYGLGLVMVSRTAFVHEEFWLFMGTAVTLWVEKRISNKKPVNKLPSNLIYTKIN